MPENLIPVIDIFAGPGGLGEGFSALGRQTGSPPFNICISVEKEPWAHQTLLLRHFFRMLHDDRARRKYFEYIMTENLAESTGHQKLFAQFPELARKAESEVVQAELGITEPSFVRKKITGSLRERGKCVLIGGPPCQAYSIAGRSRNMGNPSYDAQKDKRQQLYIEYLQILADHRPAVFIMENVKGLLSATLNNRMIFENMMDDLSTPHKTLKKRGRGIYKNGKPVYNLFPLIMPNEAGLSDSRDFVVKMEDYGIPQMRHRLIILGIRSDLGRIVPLSLARTELNLEDGDILKNIPAGMVLRGLPKLRSGLSRETDEPARWKKRIKELTRTEWFKSIESTVGTRIQKKLKTAIKEIGLDHLERGGEFIHRSDVSCEYRADWYIDPLLEGVCNHQTRIHIVEDLHRYFYAICYASACSGSPDLKDFPVELLPKHRNVEKALREGHFEDRFRVLKWDRPATTVTSHLSKDGHYFIHPDPAQCRSITVREAARLQTFPDNYFFCGPRTAQYIQVGNAVPPLLALQIAENVRDILDRAGIID